MRAADRKRKSLGRQKGNDIRRSHRLAIEQVLSLVVMFCNCQIVSKLPTRHLCVVNHICTS